MRKNWGYEPGQEDNAINKDIDHLNEDTGAMNIYLDLNEGTDEN